jgi:hypothetical protein
MRRADASAGKMRAGYATLPSGPAGRCMAEHQLGRDRSGFGQSQLRSHVSWTDGSLATMCPASRRKANPDRDRHAALV